MRDGPAPMSTSTPTPTVAAELGNSNSNSAALARLISNTSAITTKTTTSTTSTSTSTSITTDKLRPSRGWLSTVRRPGTSPAPRPSPWKRSLFPDDQRRDSALAPSNSTASTDPSSHNAPSSPTDTNPSLRRTPSLPTIVVQDDPAAHAAQARTHYAFLGIDTIIPAGDFDDLSSPTQISFSKRGSMLLGGKRVNRMNKQMGLVAEAAPAPAPLQPAHEKDHHARPPVATAPATPAPAQKDLNVHSSPATPRLSPRSPSRFSARGRASNRVLSADESMLSRKVRAMYRHGREGAAGWGDAEEESGSAQASFVDSSITNTPVNSSTLTVDRNKEDTVSIRSSSRDNAIVRETTEVAGGLEDWTDIHGGQVDRYGFILPKKTGNALDGPDQPCIQRVSTALQLISEEPRKRGVTRSGSAKRSARPSKPTASPPRRRRSQRSSKAQGSVHSNQTARATSQRPLRQAANRLPYNKDRRLMDEASDMLKLPPGLADLAEQADGGKAEQAMRLKEIQREEKWRKMAKVVQTGTTKGGGMIFEFDIKDPKVIARTWKGIPDRWRGTAWYAFLAASSRAYEDSPTDEELIESFYELQEESSADDMQIDVDVPRTINRHIMFRRRYRGGQRLLFRVLHAMSLYLPDTGYVQGMAALAATLLCYYEEDKAFVMLVRLWMFRGLEKLYESGFAGLMDALEDFEKDWLRGGEVATKLEELGITSTAYGTRWYLTLFNYSLPFPAQLRVWDVFMLLGDASPPNPSCAKSSGDLDVLHATSAALIDATREILLDSDFENAMKVLTSWIPIKDEDLLMRVAKAEYKLRKKRANA